MIKSKKRVTHSMAHYLLAIHKLRESGCTSRITDISNELELTKGSVSLAITNLKKKNLVKEDSKRSLYLTHNGHKNVHDILTNRTLVYYFFKDYLKVSEEISHKDSCNIEHLLSEETQCSLFNFMKNIPTNHSILSDFKTYDEFKNGQKGDSYL